MATIRKAEINDVAELLVLENELFSPPYKEEDLLYFIQEPNYARVAVLSKKAEIIGFYIILIMFEEAQIVQLAIKQAYQRLGYAKQLLQDIIARAKEQGCEKLTLEVRVSNEKAWGLYQQFGFKPLAMRKDYYVQPQEDAVILGRNLL